MTAKPNVPYVHSTAGAIPVKNEKGGYSMQMVKVNRYVAGKRPGFANSSASESEVDEENEKDQNYGGFTIRQNQNINNEKIVDDSEKGLTEQELEDPRFRRLFKNKTKTYQESSSSSEDDEMDRVTRHKRDRLQVADSDGSDKRSDEEENVQEINEIELERRRELVRQRVLQARLCQEDRLVENAEGEVFVGFNENEDECLGLSEAEEEDEEVEYTSSEDEMAPKLKPVFVRKRDRITLKDKQKATQIAHETELEAKRMTDERRKDTLKLMEAEIRRELEEARAVEEALDAIDSDEGQGDPLAEQEEYEKWKVRELRRIRRDKEARESVQQEKEEIDRVRQLTEEQRQEEFRRNPKLVTNKAMKGKYKFMQKYFHRGAFYVSTEEENVFKRDFAQPTLEDHFDKTKLPAVMQVKNFGLAGRTKYTHLVDQDTTSFDSPWSANTMSNVKFQEAHGGGLKSVFAKPFFKPKKKDAV